MKKYTLLVLGVFIYLAYGIYERYSFENNQDNLSNVDSNSVFKAQNDSVKRRIETFLLTKFDYHTKPKDVSIHIVNQGPSADLYRVNCILDLKTNKEQRIIVKNNVQLILDDFFSTRKYAATLKVGSFGFLGSSESIFNFQN